MLSHASRNTAANCHRTAKATLDARFPGQWFQIESGLHYNWHRHYDPTLGRYTQPDPLGFVDGPSVYGYAVGSPGMAVDPDGRRSLTVLGGRIGAAAGAMTPIPGGAAIGAAVGMAAGAAIDYICQMANRPPGYWDGPAGAREYGRRNNIPAREVREKFHEIKQNDPGSRGGDDYYVNPATGDVIGPSGESAGNLGE